MIDLKQKALQKANEIVRLSDNLTLINELFGEE